MYREWSLSKTLTADNGEVKHEMPNELIGSADDSSFLEMDDDPMDHIVNNIELPIYTGLFEFLGVLLHDDEEDDEETQHEEESETRSTVVQNETSRERGGGVDNVGERQDNSISSQSTNEDFKSSQNESETTNKEFLQHSLIMQGEDRSDPLPKKERDMRLSVRGSNKGPMSLPVILDDSSKSSKASSLNSLHKTTEKVQTNSSRSNAPVVTKERRVLRQKGPFKRNTKSALNTTAPTRKSLTKPKESRSGGNARVKTPIPNKKVKPVVRTKTVDIPVHPPQRRNKLDFDEEMNKRILEGKKRREEYERKYEISKANRFRLFARNPSHSKIYAPSNLKQKSKSNVVMRVVTPNKTSIERNKKTKSKQAVTLDQARKFYEKQLKLQQETIRKIRAQSEKHCERC